MLLGCITCSASACGTLSYFWLTGAASFHMRRCGAGARSSAKGLPIAAAADHDRGDKWYSDEAFIRASAPTDRRRLPHCPD
jgi:hypothetical protein